MTDTSPYDLTKSEQDLQRYFIYKAIEKDGQTVLKGQCRKCNQDYSRAGRSTTNMTDRLEKCDKAGKEKRKYNSTPTTPRTQPTISSSFKVYLEKLLNLISIFRHWLNGRTMIRNQLHKINGFLNGCALTLNHLIQQKACVLAESSRTSKLFSYYLGNLQYFRHRVKSRTFMTKLMEDEYAVEFGKLVERLKSAKHIAFTTDTWSSKNSARSFIGLFKHLVV